MTKKVGNPFNDEGRKAMFDLVDIDQKELLDLDDLKRISEQLKYNLTDDELQEVVNNVSGFGKK